MAKSPYFHYIQRYFPPEQWQNADCISVAECSPDRDNYPKSCVGEEGTINCGNGPVPNARSWGVFQILDACWSPYLNPASPFTKAQWDQVLDPNVNTWMASVIWAGSGWHAWTTCQKCEVCAIPGGTIPHPEGPIGVVPPVVIPEAPTTTTQNGLILAGLALLGVGVGVLVLERRQHE